MFHLVDAVGVRLWACLYCNLRQAEQWGAFRKQPLKSANGLEFFRGGLPSRWITLRVEYFVIMALKLPLVLTLKNATVVVSLNRSHLGQLECYFVRIRYLDLDLVCETY